VEAGNDMINTFDAVETPWRSHYRTIKTADDLLNNARNVTLGDSTLSGILTISYLFKAMSLGELLQLYQRIPITTYHVTAPTFVDRATALAPVLALLDSALTPYKAFDPGNEIIPLLLADGPHV